MSIGKAPIKDEPRGFFPVGRILSTHEYEATAAVIGAGDLVALSVTGKVLAAAAGGTQIMGVAVNHKASSVTTVLVYDDPNQQFAVQDDATGNTVLLSTHQGLNFDILATVANTTLKKSQHELARGGASTTQIAGPAQLRLLGLISVTGANSMCRVVINEHFLKKSGGSV